MQKPRLFKNIQKPMAKEAKAPKADEVNDTEEPKMLHVIVDKSGVLLRLEVDGEELVEDTDYELYEEETEDEETTAPNPGTPEAPHAKDSDACTECGGSGLKDSHTLCEACEGSGKGK